MLATVPQEVLQNIAAELVLDDAVGLGNSLTPLLCTCKSMNERIGRECKGLYARLFRSKFDVSAARRRYGADAVYNSSLAHQYELYIRTLALIRARSIDTTPSQTLFILWNTFLMLSENDGKNRDQLEWAGIDDWIDRFMRTRLNERTRSTGQWPIEDQLTSLTVWIYWMLLTPEKLANESEARHEQIVDLLLPYVILPCRYAAEHAPPNHFVIPFDFEAQHQTYPVSIATAHGGYPLYRPPAQYSTKRVHFGRLRDLGTPLITISARLIYFAIREITPVTVPPGLPRDRAHAIELGRTFVAPTEEDVHEFNAHKHAKLVPRTRWDWWEDLRIGGRQLELELHGEWSYDRRAPSTMWDADAQRWLYCWNPWNYALRPLISVPRYKYGVLHGLWQGRMLVPSQPQYMALIMTPEMPENFDENTPFVTTVPLYMRLREHRCINPEVGVIAGGPYNSGVDNGMINGWLPTCRMSEGDGKLRVQDQDGDVSFYETWRPDGRSSHSDDTCRVCKKRKAEEEARYRELTMKRQEAYEDLFTSYGLGLDSAASSHYGDTDVEDEDDEDDAVEAEEGSSAYASDTDEASVDSLADVPCDGVLDTIITGETDLSHGQAWNHFNFFGRIRYWDGLVCLVREAAGGLRGRQIFVGYLVMDTNFVGTWRAMGGGDALSPHYESAFSVSKRA